MGTLRVHIVAKEMQQALMRSTTPTDVTCVPNCDVVRRAPNVGSWPHPCFRRAGAVHPDVLRERTCYGAVRGVEVTGYFCRHEFLASECLSDPAPVSLRPFRQRVTAPAIVPASAHVHDSARFGQFPQCTAVHLCCGRERIRAEWGSNRHRQPLATGHHRLSLAFVAPRARTRPGAGWS